MKEINIIINSEKVVQLMKQETANTAARAELMGIAGIYDVMSLNDEEVDMIKDWIEHSMSDLYMLANKKMRDTLRTVPYTIKGYMSDNFDDEMTTVINSYANKYVLDELMIKWMRWSEASTTMKGIQSPLAKEWAKVRDADWLLLNSALNSRKRPNRSNNENKEEQKWEEPESNIVGE